MSEHSSTSVRRWRWSADAAGAYTSLDERLSAHVGNGGALLGRAWFEALAPEEAQRAGAAFARAAATHDSLELRCRLRAPDGGPGIDVLARAIPHFDARGALAGFAGEFIALDHAAAGEVPPAAAAVLEHTILGAMGASVIVTDLQERVIFWNRGAEELYGWSAEETAGRPIRDFILPPGEGDQADHILDGARGGEPWEGEFMLRRRDGRVVTVHASLTPVAGDDGRPAGIIGVSRDVTGRSEAFARLDALLMSSPVGIALLDREGRYARVNEALARISGVPAAEHLGRRPAEIVPELATQLEARVAEVLESGETRAFEVSGETVGHPGEHRHWFVSYFPVVHPNGEVIGTGGAVVDITERRRAEAALGLRLRQQATVTDLGHLAVETRDIDALLQKTVEAVAETLQVEVVATLELSPDRRELTVSASVGLPQRTGQVEPVERGSQSGYTLLSDSPVVVEDLAAETRFEVSPSLRQLGLAAGMSVVLRGHEQSWGVLTAHSRQPRHFSGDDATFLQAVANIVSGAIERDRADAELRFLAEATTVLSSSLEPERTLDSLTALAVPHLADMCGIYLVHSDGRSADMAVVHVDPEKVEATREMRERWPVDARSTDLLGRVLRSGEPIVIERMTEEWAREFARDGEHLERIKALQARSALVLPLRARNRILGVMVLGHGDSKRRYSEGDLPLAQEFAARVAQAVENALLYREAQEAARVRDDFVSIASHELRSPLTSVLGFSARLARRAERGGALDESALDELQTLHSEAERMRATLELFLDLARLDSEQFTIETEPVDLSGVVREEAAALRKRYPEATLEERYPATAAIIESDEARIRQVVTNLLENAVKYGGERPEVRLTLEVGAEHVAVRVRDNGAGIDPVDAPHIFERYYRGQSGARARTKGLGLGLYVSRGVAERLNATLSFETEPGAGTEFTLALPRDGTVEGAQE